MKESLVKRHMAGVRERKGGNIKKKLNMNRWVFSTCLNIIQ